MGHGRECAYSGCKKTTDKRSFGHVNRLSPSQLSSYSSWLKPQHDGVLCNCHYTLLRRLLAKQGNAQEDSAARMEALLSAPGIVDSLASSPSSPSTPFVITVSVPPLTTPIQANDLLLCRRCPPPPQPSLLLPLCAALPLPRYFVPINADVPVSSDMCSPCPVHCLA